MERQPQATDGTSSKKSPFDNLDKDELIKKCKALLSLARNAKQTKDEYAVENAKLKEDLDNFEQQKAADKESLKAMQEVVDSLTEQKLAQTVRISDLDRANSTLLSDLSIMRDDQKVAARISSNTESIKTELQRLSQENAELIVTNKKLEVEVKKADDKLVKAIECADDTDYEQLKDKFDKLVFDQQTLEKLNVELVARNDQLNLNEQKYSKCADDQKLLLSKCKSQESKLRLYKTKLIDFSSQLKQLKGCKEILLKTVHEYSQAVSKWQSEIVTVSNEFFEKNRLLRKENKVLKEWQSETTDSICKLTEELKARHVDIEQYKEKYTQLLEGFALLQLEKEKLSTLLDTLRSDATDTQHKASDGVQRDDEKQALHNLLNEAEKNNAQYKADLNIQVALNEQNQHLKQNERNVILAKVESTLSKYNDMNELAGELRDELDYLRKEIDQQKLCADASIEHANQHCTESQRNFVIQIKDLQGQLAAAAQSVSADEHALNVKKLHELEIVAVKLKVEQDCQIADNIKLKTQFADIVSSKDKLLEETVQKNDKLVQSKVDELADLLDEMRELNEALKIRGDIISQQEQRIVDLETTRATLAARIVHAEATIEAKSSESDVLAERVKELEHAVHMNESNSEQLSTSTVSRVEEMARMRDIDDSFEDKYNRLRAVAIKLKKKVAEQTKMLADLESKNNQNCAEEVQIHSKLGNIEVQVRNLQLLQSENDRLQDQLEAAKAERKEYNSTVAKLSTELAALRTLSADNESGALASSKQKSALEKACKEYVKQIQTLKEELNASLVSNKSVTEEFHTLKDELKAMSVKNICLTEEHTKLNAELNKVKATVTNSNVLSLEMEVYEKSLKDVSIKLEAKNLELNELKSTIQSYDDAADNHRKQMSLLETNIDDEKNYSIDLQKQIDQQRTVIGDSERVKLDLKAQIEELRRDKNSSTEELEEFKLNSVQMISEKDKLLRQLQTDNDKQIRELVAAKTNINELQNTLQTFQQQFTDVSNEFSNYKVRAQSMLRQSQTKESSHESELGEQLRGVQDSLKSVQQKFDAIFEQNKQLLSTIEEVTLDKERMVARSKDLSNMLDAARHTVDSLEEEKRIQSVNHQEELKLQRLQSETLSECYKKQFTELDRKHSEKLEELKRLTSVNQHSQDDIRMGGGPDQKKMFPYKNTTTDEQKIDWLLMERQEGEGSESASGSYLQRKSSRGRRELIPLDELLNNSFEENLLTDGGSLEGLFDQQLLSEQLGVQKSRVKHLTTLLAEAEQDTARLTQLNDMLKEEVRRQERSAEREQHLHNLEYLKNVIFKFLTIGCGDEKTHLIPVLNTILKLSPEETVKLQNVAKGGAQGLQKGWGRYLPI